MDVFLPKFGNLESDAEQSHSSWHVCLLRADSSAGRGGGDRARWIWGGLRVGFKFRYKLWFLEAITLCPPFSAMFNFCLDPFPAMAMSDRIGSLLLQRFRLLQRLGCSWTVFVLWVISIKQVKLVDRFLNWQNQPSSQILTDSEKSWVGIPKIIFFIQCGELAYPAKTCSCY